MKSKFISQCAQYTSMEAHEGSFIESNFSLLYLHITKELACVIAREPGIAGAFSGGYVFYTRVASAMPRV